MAKSPCMQSNEQFFVEAICPSWQLSSRSDGKLKSDSRDTVSPNSRHFYCSVAFSRFYLLVYLSPIYFLSLYINVLIYKYII